MQLEEIQQHQRSLVEYMVMKKYEKLKNFMFRSLEIVF